MVTTMLQLHHGSHMPIIKNLKKKVKKGVYDSEKAKVLWGHHADRAAQSYHKEYGDKHTPCLAQDVHYC